MPRIKDTAIVIRETDWSESSQLVTLLTAEHGKVRGLAKGSKRQAPSSVARFSGGIDLLTRGQIVASLRAHTEGGLATLTEWNLEEPNPHLRRNLAALRTALYGADLANAMLADHDAHPGAFTAMNDFLQALADPSVLGWALLVFQAGLLTDCGYKPQLCVDVATGEELPRKSSYLFDPRAGGLRIDERTLRGDETGPGPWRIRRETVELLRALMDQSGQTSWAHDDPTIARANRLLCVYARHILDRELPTMRIVLGTW